MAVVRHHTTLSVRWIRFLCTLVFLFTQVRVRCNAKANNNCSKFSHLSRFPEI